MKKVSNKNMEAAENVMPVAETQNESVKQPVKKNYKPRNKHNKKKFETHSEIVISVESEDNNKIVVEDVFVNDVPEVTKKEKSKFIKWLQSILKW